MTALPFRAITQSISFSTETSLPRPKIKDEQGAAQQIGWPSYEDITPKTSFNPPIQPQLPCF
jgi:hypothetical protein